MSKIIQQFSQKFKHLESLCKKGQQFLRYSKDQNSQQLRIKQILKSNQHLFKLKNYYVNNEYTFDQFNSYQFFIKNSNQNIQFDKFSNIKSKQFINFILAKQQNLQDQKNQQIKPQKNHKRVPSGPQDVDDDDDVDIYTAYHSNDKKQAKAFKKEEQKQIDDVTIFNAKAEKLLPDILGTVEVKKFINHSIGILSAPGMVALDDTKKNQDNLIFYPQFNKNEDMLFVAVLDGHGPSGEKAANFISKQLPNFLEKGIQQRPFEFLEGIKQGFFQANQKLWEQNFDTYGSGTTCTSVLLSKDKIYSINTGDSRTICAKFNSTLNKNEAIQISNDHKPDVPYEKKRIEDHGGLVYAYKDENGIQIGPNRMWYQGSVYPAVSRSFGDMGSKDLGLIEEPEINIIDRTSNDKFIVLGSDGLFDYLPNQQIVDIVNPYYEKNEIREAAQKLIESARNSWTNQKFGYIDDITCLIIFFNYNQ